LRFRFGNVPGEQYEPSAEAGLTRIHSPSARLGYLLAGLVGLALPAVLFACFVAISLLSLPHEIADAAADTPVEAPMPWGAVILALLLFIPLHELTHAVLHPGFGLSPQTVMVIWPTKLRFGVYYAGCMTRRRWLLMRLAPLACLSVVPILLLTLFRVVLLPFPIEIFWQVLTLMNFVGSGGDLVAAIWVLFQVPAGAEICFRGGKAYWR
jgi:hypothetical protein